MNAWIFLGLAIVLEVTGTFLLKLSNGFEKWHWGALSIFCYSACFWVLAPAMKVLPVGIVYPHQLSGGEQQRIALVRALAPQPQAVLLDEAFSSLDRHLRRSVGAETRRLLKQSGAAVLMVTHDADEAMELGDHLLVMDRGRIIDRGASEKVYWRPANAVSAQLFGEINVLTGICKNGMLDTAIGKLPAPDLPDGGQAEVLFRPEAVKLQTDGSNIASIMEVGRIGAISRIVLRLSGRHTLVVSEQGFTKRQCGDRLSFVLQPESYAAHLADSTNVLSLN